MPGHLDIFQGRTNSNSPVPVSSPMPQIINTPRPAIKPLPKYVDYGPLGQDQEYFTKAMIDAGITNWDELNQAFRDIKATQTMDIFGETGSPPPGPRQSPKAYSPDYGTFGGSLLGGMMSVSPGMGLAPTTGQELQATQKFIGEDVLSPTDKWLRHQVGGPMWGMAVNAISAVEQSSVEGERPDVGDVAVEYQKQISPWMMGGQGYTNPFLTTPPVDLIDMAGRENLQEFEKKKRDNQNGGMSVSEAARQAYYDTEFNPYFKGGIEAILDPWAGPVEALIPGGLLAKPLRAGLKVGLKGAAAGGKGAGGAIRSTAGFGLDAFRDIRAATSSNPIYGLMNDIRKAEIPMEFPTPNVLYEPSFPAPRFKTPTRTIYDDISARPEIGGVKSTTRRLEIPMFFERLKGRTLAQAGGPSQPEDWLQQIRDVATPSGSVSPDEFSDLQTFIEYSGVHPSRSGDEMIGTSRINPTNGKRFYVMGAFDDPSGLAKADARNYITYTPEDKQWAITLMPDETPPLIDVQTGNNITKQIDDVIANADDELRRIEALEARTPNIGPEWYKLQQRRKAVNASKASQIERLEGKATEPIIKEVPTVSATLDEQLEFSETWGNLYENTLTKPINSQPIESTMTRNFNQYRKQLRDNYQHEIMTYSHGSIADAHHAALSRTARQRGLPEPPVPPGKAGWAGATPGDPVGEFDIVLNPKHLFETVDPNVLDEYTFFREWDGARSVANQEVRAFLDEANDILGEANKAYKGTVFNSKYIQGQYVIPRELGEPLLKALHGEGPIPEGYEKFIAHIKKLQQQEQSSYLAFDPGLEDVFASHPNYFPRIWKRKNLDTGEYESFYDIKNNHPGNTAKKYDKSKLSEMEIPEHLRPRADDTFTTLLKKGWEPESWNPATLMANRRINGIEHREQILLVQKLKKSGEALPSDFPDIPQGWRVPQVGPAFEGYRMPGKWGNTVDLSEWYVSPDTAALLEGVWGKTHRIPISIMGKEINLVDILKLPATTLKRSILLFSGFQHADMLTRGYSSGFSYRGATSGILHGEKGKFWNSGLYKNLPLTSRILTGISYTGDLSRKTGVNFINAGRRATRERAIDATPFYDDFVGKNPYTGEDEYLSMKLINEMGWQSDGDLSIIGKSAQQFIEEFTNEFSKYSDEVGIPEAELIFDRMKGAAKFWETGLFEVAYREVQMHMLETMIVPNMMRKYPKDTPRVIAQRAADEVNILSSSLGPWQSWFKSPEARSWAQIGFFSSNEFESMMRAVGKAVKGDAKGLYREYWAGWLTFVGATANIINQSVTGEWLGADAYSPINIRHDDGATIPYKPAYNSEWLSPVIGHGRNGQEIHWDIVGQMDTPFTFMSDPIGALVNRLGPLPGLIKPFAKEETFYGEPLETGGDQIMYALMSNLPMGARNFIQSQRDNSELIAKLFPEEESGLGGLGESIQTAGLNVRRTTTRDLLDELSRRAGFASPPKELDDPSTWIFNPTPYDVFMRDTTPDQRARIFNDPRNKDIFDELALRRDTGVSRGDEYQISRTDKEKNRDLRLEREAALVNDIKNNKVPLSGRSGIGWFDSHYRPLQREEFIKNRQIDETLRLYDDKDELPEDKLPRARVQYYRLWDQFALANGTETDYDGLEIALERLIANEWDEDQVAHIDELRDVDYGVRHEDPFIIGILTEKEKYKPYFRYTHNIMEATNMSGKYKNYLNSNDPTGFLQLPENKDFANILDDVEITKTEMRENDLELARLLRDLGKMGVRTFADIEQKFLRSQPQGVSPR
jgi:hypothetical protein